MSDAPATPPAPAAAGEARARAAPDRPAASTAARRAAPLLVDLLALALLLAVAMPLRWSYTQGDLWYDEADYAFAALRGSQANRLDRSDVPSEPERLLRFRHYHPPLVAYMGALALRRGPATRTLRIPAVAAGTATVVLVYLAGLMLFGAAVSLVKSAADPSGRSTRSDERVPPWVLVRLLALVCALVVAVTPANVRAGSHLLPWAFLILELLLLLYALMGYAARRHPVWIPVACAALAGLFVTTEYFFPALLCCACVVPFLCWRARAARTAAPGIPVSLVAGVCLFLAIALVLWPAGLTGGALKMLGHYVAMAHDPWPVIIRGHAYERAPKWAYLYWYWRDYRVYLGLYALGAVGLMGLAVRRRLPAAGWTLGVFAAVLLLAAHRSHIIGPEYLAHVLPFLTLMSGLFFVGIARYNRWLAVGLAVAACLVVVRKHDPGNLSGMDPQSQVARWPAAARAIAARWRPGDRVLAQQYGVVGRWYVLHAPGVQAKEWQVQALPSYDTPKLLADVTSGVYRFVAVGSTVSEQPVVAPRVWRVIAKWPVLWRSPEPPGRSPRLVVYLLPRGVTHRHPLPTPL